MEEHQKRVVLERAELEDRREKLEAFLNGEKYKTLPEDEQNRLGEQAMIMLLYTSVLNRRIAAFL